MQLYYKQLHKSHGHCAQAGLTWAEARTCLTQGLHPAAQVLSSPKAPHLELRAL